MSIKISLYFVCFIWLLTNIQVHGHAENRQQRIKLGVGKYTAGNQQHSSFINDVGDNRVFSPVPRKHTYQQIPIYRIQKNNNDNEQNKKETSVVRKISRVNSKQLEIPTNKQNSLYRDKGQENRVEKLKLLKNNIPQTTQLEAPPFVEKKIRKNSKQLQFRVNDEMINENRKKINKNSIKNKNGNKYTNNRVKNQKLLNRRNQPFRRITNKRNSKEQQERFIAYINRYVENALNRRQQQILELEKNKPKTPVQAQQLLNKRVKMPLANNSNNKMNNIKQEQQQQQQNVEQHEKPATENINVANEANT